MPLPKSSRPRLGRILALLALAAAGFAAVAPGGAATRAKTTVNDCLWELARGQGSHLRCSYPARLADKERDDLRRLTRERLQDAECTVSIDIARSLVTRVLTTRDLEFEAPPQPVACEIATRGKPVTIEATFAPRVVIKDGIAVDATPGLANVTGVNSYLAWPVVEYVNRSGTMKTEMLKTINAYLSLRVARGL